MILCSWRGRSCGYVAKYGAFPIKGSFSLSPSPLAMFLSFLPRLSPLSFFSLLPRRGEERYTRVVRETRTTPIDKKLLRIDAKRNLERDMECRFNALKGPACFIPLCAGVFFACFIFLAMGETCLESFNCC